MIQQGEIEQPELMGFNRWEQWRRDRGRRPLIRIDGEVTTSRQEAELWRETMLHFYGENWQVDLAVEEAHVLERQGAAGLPVTQEVSQDGAQPSRQRAV